MIKKIFFVLLAALIFTPKVFADVADLNPVIKSYSNVELNKSIIFDAASSIVTEESGSVVYEWHFGDGNKQEGTEVVHSYANPGEYEVTLTMIPTNGEQVSAIQKVFVYKNSFALVTDVDTEADRISNFVDSAKKENIFVDLIANYTEGSEFLSEDSLLRKISDNLDSLESVDTIVIWTKGTSGLTVLSQLQKSVSKENFFDNKKGIINN